MGGAGVDRHDRRQTLVRLTEAGRRALAGIQQRAEHYLAETTLSPLTATERRQLMAMLKRLTDVLGQSDAGAPRHLT